MSTPTEKAIALDRLAKQADSAAAPSVDYTFGILPGPERPDRNEGESTEDYQTRMTAWREDNPNQWGVTHWDSAKLSTEPTASEIEAEAIKGPTLPLQTRLRAILATQPAAVRAAFLPITAGVNYALEQGDTEAALAAITATEVPAELEPAKAALIAEFEV